MMFLYNQGANFKKIGLHTLGCIFGDLISKKMCTIKRMVPRTLKRFKKRFLSVLKIPTSSFTLHHHATPRYACPHFTTLDILSSIYSPGLCLWGTYFVVTCLQGLGVSSPTKYQISKTCFNPY